MDSSSSSAALQLRRLCNHILGPGVSDDVLSTQFRAALQILSSSSSGQENARDNEFLVAEKIKKFLVSLKKPEYKKNPLCICMFL